MLEEVLLLTADAFTSQNGALLIDKEMELAVDGAAVERKEVIGISLPGHTINSEVPHHLDGAVFHLMRMKVGRAKLNVQVGDLPPDPSLDDAVPGLIRPCDIALGRVLALSRGAASQDRSGKAQDPNHSALPRQPHFFRKECVICGVHHGVDVQCRDAGSNRAQRRGHDSKLQPTVAGRIE